MVLLLAKQKQKEVHSNQPSGLRTSKLKEVIWQNKSDSAAVETTPRGQSSLLFNISPDWATQNFMLLLANRVHDYAYLEISDMHQARSLEINAVKITPCFMQEDV